MLEIWKGDKGPRVVALQKLINQVLETDLLSVDGIFGPLTEEGVRRVQARLDIPVTGWVDRNTWNAIEAVTPYHVVNVADIYDSSRDRVMPEDFRNPYLIRLGGMSGGLQQFVYEILRRTRKRGSIVFLRIFGHGRSGLMAVSAGDGRLRDYRGIPIELPPEQKVNHEEHHSILTITTIRRSRTDLMRLRPLFCPYASVELHGCRVGDGDDGKRLLRALAFVLGVPVTAGIEKQSFGEITAHRFEGRVRTVYPRPAVNLRTWIRRCVNHG